MTEKEKQLSIFLVSVLVSLTVAIYFAAWFRPVTPKEHRIAFADLFADDDETGESAQQYNKKTVRFRRANRTVYTGIAVNYPKSPYTLIVPSEETLQKQVFVQQLASKQEYDEIQHLIRKHFHYTHCTDIEQFKDHDYPFWYCVDCDGGLNYVDGKEVSPYDFVTKRQNECCSIMVAENLDAKPCDDPECFFVKTPDEYLAQMQSDEYANSSTSGQ